MDFQIPNLFSWKFMTPNRLPWNVAVLPENGSGSHTQPLFKSDQPITTLLREFAQKYCLYNFWMWGTLHEPSQNRNQGGLDILTSRQQAIKEKSPIFESQKMIANDSVEVDGKSTTEMPSPSCSVSSKSKPLLSLPKKNLNATVGKFQNHRKLGKSGTFKARDRSEKTLEREFTSMNSRKDVVYKALLRYMKRNYEERFRASHPSPKVVKSKPTNSVSQVKLFLSKTLEEVDDKLAYIFISMIDSRREHKRYGASSEVFRKNFTKCLLSFNFKNLSSCLKNKSFSTLVVNFWRQEGVWGDFVRSINQKIYKSHSKKGKRGEPINSEAYRHYLEKLVLKCKDVLEE